jgi:hypothetical protein
MANSNLQIKSEIAEYIKNDIVPKIPSEIEQFIPDNIDKLIDSIYVLRYYCSRKGINSNSVDILNNIIETCQALWELLDTNTKAFLYLIEMYKVRKLDLISNIIGQYEEVTSGEESFRDFVLESIATYFGWKADNIWIDQAKIDQEVPLKFHVRRLRNELWKLLDDFPKNENEINLPKAIDISEKMNLLLNLIISDETPPVGRALLLSTIYTLLIRLKLDRAISVIGDHENQ